MLKHGTISLSNATRVRCGRQGSKTPHSAEGVSEDTAATYMYELLQIIIKSCYNFVDYSATWSNNSDYHLPDNLCLDVYKWSKAVLDVPHLGPICSRFRRQETEKALAPSTDRKCCRKFNALLWMTANMQRKSVQTISQF